MDKYNQRGVSASKEDVHNAIKNIDKGLYPNAFCKIIPDLLGGGALDHILLSSTMVPTRRRRWSRC